MDTVKLLLEKGASAVSPIQSGATPMSMAVFMGAPRPAAWTAARANASL